jgi:hypothetical protein
VLYEIHVSDQDSFELVSDDRLKVGELITQFSTVYEVTRVRDGHGRFDAVVDAERRAGPAQSDSP